MSCTANYNLWYLQYGYLHLCQLQHYSYTIRILFFLIVIILQWHLIYTCSFFPICANLQLNNKYEIKY